MNNLPHADSIHSGVKSAARVLDIFELLVRHRDGISLSEICAVLDLPKSSGHALLMTLIKRGCIAAMSIAVPSVRFNPARRDELLALVLSEARRLSIILGFTAARHEPHS